VLLYLLLIAPHAARTETIFGAAFALCKNTKMLGGFSVLLVVVEQISEFMRLFMSYCLSLINSKFALVL
jgi:hypothetical protein